MKLKMNHENILLDQSFAFSVILLSLLFSIAFVQSTKDACLVIQRVCALSASDDFLASDCPQEAICSDSHMEGSPHLQLI